MRPETFQQLLAPYLSSEWPLATRLQASNAFFPSNCFIKREDEQSSSIQGSKYRKYASLVAYWQQKGIQELEIWGSAFSNNVLGLVQLANANSCHYTVHLLANQDKPPLTGNHLWIRLAARSNARVHYYSREKWHQQSVPETLRQGSHLTIPEGAYMAQAMPGCMTLGAEIVQQEKALGKSFQHIFIDAGTGLTAISLILALAIMGATNKTVHTTLISGSEDAFKAELKQFQKRMVAWGWLSNTQLLPGYHLYRPPTAKAFGAINRSILKTVKSISHLEGILTDPIYGAKHALSANSIIQAQNITEPSLFIHDGGGLALSGFQESLSAITDPLF